MNQDVLGYLITWSVYGTFLQGDARWWHKRMQGPTAPQPLLVKWHRDRLKYPILLLSEIDRFTVEEAIEKHAALRDWRVWAKNARSNHVHTVITANGVTAQKVRDQLKANCTYLLRERFKLWSDRPVWSVGGHCDWLETQEELERAIEYVDSAQDRKHLDELR